MPRPEKVRAVAEIKERIEGAQAVFLAEYAGLSVKDQQTLRRELRASGAEFKVVKMSLARRAAGELKIDFLDELLLGPTGLAFADGDPAGAAKVLRDFAKGHDVFVVKGGLLGIEFLSSEKIAELADIEPREVLLAKLAGVMKAPMANLAALLGALPRNTASVLKQLLEKKEAGEFIAPGSEALADEAETSSGAEATASPQEADADEPTDEEAVVEVVEDVADDAAKGSDDDPNDSEETEDKIEVVAEVSDDAGDVTAVQADEASQDDAEEE